MRDLADYIKEVDQALEDLRAKCLGQDVSFHVLLPEEAEFWPCEEKAEYITKLLLFSLAKVEPCFSIVPELEESSAWLKTLLLYLMKQCNPEDQTFANVTKITRLDGGIRECMFEDNAYAVLCTTPPFLLHSLDLAILSLLDTRALVPGNANFLTQIKHHINQAPG